VGACIDGTKNIALAEMRGEHHEACQFRYPMERRHNLRSGKFRQAKVNYGHIWLSQPKLIDSRQAVCSFTHNFKVFFRTQECDHTRPHNMLIINDQNPDQISGALPFCFAPRSDFKRAGLVQFSIVAKNH
jgi:hypothetical protein